MSLDNDQLINVAIVGVGKLGNEVCEYLKNQIELPLSYPLFSDYLIYDSQLYTDILIFLGESAERSSIETIIHNTETDAIIIILAIDAEPFDLKRLGNIDEYSCILIPMLICDHNDLMKASKACYDAEIVVKNLVRPFYQENLLGLEFAELKYILSNGKIALAFYAIAPGAEEVCNKVFLELVNVNLKLDADSMVLVNVIQKKLSLTISDLVISLIYSKFPDIELTVCLTHDQHLDSEIALLFIVSVGCDEH